MDTANRLFNAAAPWKLLDDGAADLAHRLLSRVVYACRTITTEIAVFCPSGAARLREQLGEGGRLGPAGPAFARLSADVGTSL